MLRMLIALCLPLFSLGAQAGRGSSSSLRDADELGFWLGAAHGSAEGVLGHAKEKDLALMTVRWTHPMVRTNSYSIEYVLDLLPAAFVSTPSRANTAGSGTTCGAADSCALAGMFANRRAIYGLGAMPIGVQFRLAPHARLQPFASASGGVLWFTDRVPDPEARRLNFAAEVGGGAVAAINSHFGFLFGYEFHHLSNGGTAPSNPGIDSNVIYAGATTFLRD